MSEVDVNAGAVGRASPAALRCIPAFVCRCRLT